jgi:hypothetical protein
MAHVEVSFRELTKSFRNLRKHAPDATEGTCCLLDALYAAECGIAALILRQNSYSTTKELVPKTHDIREMLKKCAVAPAHNLPSRLSVTPLKNARKNHVLFANLHSALRYGATLYGREWKECAREVTKLNTWIDNNLKRR